MEIVTNKQTGNTRVDLISSVRPVDEDVVKQVEAEFAEFNSKPKKVEQNEAGNGIILITP